MGPGRSVLLSNGQLCAGGGLGLGGVRGSKEQGGSRGLLGIGDGGPRYPEGLVTPHLGQ